MGKKEQQMFRFLRRTQKNNEADSIAEFRKQLLWRKNKLYGQKVQFLGPRVTLDEPEIGTIGHVLTEAEHGIKRYAGFTTIDPKLSCPLMGAFCKVNFSGSEKVYSKYMLAPV